jgi:transcription elongation factor GreA
MADDFFTDGVSLGDNSGSGSSAQQEDDHEDTFVTKEGLKKLKEEYEHLKTVRRKEVAQRLKEAISYGDLSENNEYEEAKNDQAFIEGRILELEQKIKSAKVIVEKTGDKRTKDANIGSNVTIKSTSDDKEETFTIVGATEANPFENKISNESPIGKALLTRVKGDTVKVTTPSGLVEYEVIKVA